MALFRRNHPTKGAELGGGDPGTGEGSENVTIPLRLAFIGFEGFAGRPTFGKQWSVYYYVAVFRRR